VAAEHFALLADVHRFLGRISEDDYTCETPDGRGRSRDEAGARLARVVCADLEMLDERDLIAIAQHVARAQVRQIVSGIRQVLRHTPRPRVAVVAGRGAFIARDAATSVSLPVEEVDSRTSKAAPAAAVACLLAKVLGA
jgi:probable H4MPT-linked C1 transfer pathway protein